MYYSRTGQTKRFTEKLLEEIPDLNIRRIETGGEQSADPYILFTPTYMRGQVPEQVQAFLKEEVNKKNLMAVVSNGNRNWGSDVFAKSGDTIAQRFGVPLLHKYELRGNSKDVNIVVSAIKELRRDQL